MTTNFIPAVELSPMPLARLSPTERVAAWLELLELGGTFSEAGLRRKIGEGGDFRSAFRDWNDRQMNDHDAMIRQMLEGLSKREQHDAL
jgi:hypothetical protein